MEKEGLYRALMLLALTPWKYAASNDRHKHVNKFFNKNHPEIEYLYDVWHVLQGKLFNLHIVYNGVKKLAKLSKYKDCEIVGAWIKCITNHM